MFDDDAYRVAIKDSALDASPAVHAYAEEAGRVVSFDSRSEARATARDLSAEGPTPVRVQAAAANDPQDVDAYLVSAPERRVREPEETASGGLTFDVGANQYGALGEALVAPYATNPPLLTHWIREDLDARVRVEVARDAEPVVYLVDGTRREWTPDCRAVARQGAEGPALAEYLCEVKTGDASFERDQRTAMRAAAESERVLTVRLAVDALPESYTAWVREVEPDGSMDARPVPASMNRRLSDFG